MPTAVETASSSSVAPAKRSQAQLKAILANDPTATAPSATSNTDADAQRKVDIDEYQKALEELAYLYRDGNDAAALAALTRSSKHFISAVAKAKGAKLIRTLIDYFGEITPSATETQIDLTKEYIEWAREGKRVFLRQSLETKLIGLYYETNAHRLAIPLINDLLRELKRLDDKIVLTEVHLLESKVNHAIGNLAKGKAALTAARTSANSIYCPPSLQAQLDMQSGVLHAEDKDYTTAYSYFFETLEGLATTGDAKAPLALKYMLLCKIMLNLPDDVRALSSGKLAIKYEGRDTQAMHAVAKAYERRSLVEFESALKEYKEELSNDPIIRNHLSALYDTLLEQNLLRIIEPYSRVEIAHVATSVGLPEREVETKLSQMILDKTFHGILDQGAGCLVVFDEPAEDKTYEASLDTLKHISNVVNSLYTKATKLS